MVSNLTKGKYLILVAQGSTNRTRTIAVVPEITTLKLVADIFFFFQVVCVNCPTPEFKNDKMKHNNIGGEPMAQILAIGTTRAEQIPKRFSLRTTFRDL